MNPLRLIVIGVACTVFWGVVAGADPADSFPQERWMSVFLDGERAGYVYARFRCEEERIHTHTLTRAEVRRGAVSVAMETESETWETFDGRPLAFRYTLTMAGQPMVYTATIGDGAVAGRSLQGGVEYAFSYPWTEGAVMVWGMERALRGLGTEPGAKAELTVYSPELRLDRPVPARIVAEGEEVRDLGDGPEQLTRVRTSLRVGASSFETINWLDAAGELRLSETDMGGMRVRLKAATQGEALAAYLPPELFETRLLHLDGPISEGADSVDFRIRFRGAPPHDFDWPRTRVQRVLEGMDDGVRLRISRSRFPVASAHGVVDGAETDARYLESNPYLNLDDPVLRVLAEEVFASDPPSDPFERADGLRRFVSGHIAEPGLDVGFATASEVARNPVGDCTEYAVLLAALGRLHGFPTRVAAGLVYLSEFGEHRDVMGYHMWTQFRIGEAWWDLDAALHESEPAPTRIAFATASLGEASMAELNLSLLRLIGRVRVAVEAVAEGRQTF